MQAFSVFFIAQKIVIDYFLLREKQKQKQNMKRAIKNLSAEKRRLVAVEAVIQLAAEKNPEHITTLQIAERMNLTQGALFRHFPTKNALWQSVMEWLASQLLGRIDRVIENTESAIEALELMFMTHLDFVVQHPGVPRMIFAELQRPDKSSAKKIVETMLASYSGRLEKLFKKGIAQGKIHPGLDVSSASVLFIGIVQGLVMQSLIAGDTSKMLSNAKPVFALFLQAIKKRER